MLWIKILCLVVFFLKIELNCDTENSVNFKMMLSNLTCVLIYSLTKCALENGLKDSCVLKNL